MISTTTTMSKYTYLSTKNARRRCVPLLLQHACMNISSIGVALRDELITHFMLLEDGMSGDVDTSKRGCGQHGAFGIGHICFVVEPANCLTAVPSLRFPGASWKLC